VLHLLVDTSTWLDLSKRRDGQRWIVALRVLIHQGEVELLVPSLVIDEYERNRERVQASMTASVAQRFKLIRQDLDDYGGTDTESALGGWCFSRKTQMTRIGSYCVHKGLSTYRILAHRTGYPFDT
jgi:hypothetical protein